jgi:ElaB/YqjD/DUF883 family membrane-anchored ribosome-binding protein
MHASAGMMTSACRQRLLRVSSMLTVHPNTTNQKRDLHVGGLGMSTSGTLAAVTDRILDAEETWLDRARDAARQTDNFVKGNPWAALAVMAAASFAAGFYLSRRR